MNDPGLAEIPGLIRCETTSREQGLALAAELTHSVYKHDDLYGQFCTLEDYIDCPPLELFEYLRDLRSLDEYTFSTRHFRRTEKAGLYVGVDTLADDTKIYLRLAANREALTVDFHCAWDQGDELWMIYLFRIIPAQTVLKRPGSVVVWTNCRHPYYDRNPHPELAPHPGRVWVGELWPLFYAGHRIELRNLKAIAEHRHRRGQPLLPAAERGELVGR